MTLPADLLTALRNGERHRLQEAFDRAYRQQWDLAVEATAATEEACRYVQEVLEPYLAGGQARQAPEAVHAREAARQLGVSVKLIYKLVHTGELPGIKVGRAVRIPVQALAEFIQGHSGGAELPPPTPPPKPRRRPPPGGFRHFPR